MLGYRAFFYFLANPPVAESHRSREMGVIGSTKKLDLITCTSFRKFVI